MNTNAYAMNNEMAMKGLFVTLASALVVALAAAGVVAVLHAVLAPFGIVQTLHSALAPMAAALI